MLANQQSQRAQAVCVFAYCEGPDYPIHLFKGQANGTIVHPGILGDGSFGWDPIFQPDGFSITYAQMSQNMKNTISHRGDAIRQLIRFLTTTFESPPINKRKRDLDDFDFP